MARYIDVDAATELARLTYCKNCNSYNGVMCRACAFDDAMSFIEDFPAADVVEVVRCKDCKYHEDLDGGVKCQRIDGLLMTLSDDYCCYGVRKGGAE